MLIPDDSWKNVTLETYREAYVEVKAKHEDLLKESESITTKSIKILLLIFGLTGWVAINILKLDSIGFLFFVLFVVLVVWALFLLFGLLFP